MKKKCIITVRDEVFCQLTGLEPQDHEFLDNKFALMVEGAVFMPLFKLGRWDGKVRFLDKAGKIYSRLLPDVLPYLESWGYEIDLKDLRTPVELVKTRIDKDYFLNKEGMELKVELRPYQVEAVNACLDATSGFIIAATGSGKTWMVAALADVMALNELRTIVIVPSDDLVKQTVATFRLGNLDVGIYSGSTKDIYHMVVVATWQALQNNPSLMNEFKCVVVDEAHGAKAKVVGDLINAHGKNIAYRFGFTGTMPKPAIDQMTLKGSIGEELFSITAAELMEMGYLAKLEIEPVEIEDDVEEDFPDYASEKAFLNKSPDRLDFIADLIIAKAERYGNTLVLVNSVKQGQQLQKLIKDSVFLHGADDTDVRAEWYSMFEKRDDLIVIATFGIASTGISIDRIFAQVMIDAGKSFVRCIQSIGRGLRLGHDKDRVHLVDVHSKLKWSKKHYRERVKFYKSAEYPVNKIVKFKL
ncbi:DEAD/DEAH box helicase family protein [Acinetobacter sp.]|uniref:DEAD/DEAH box helicase family protein n=1 Tax=Acinetobacter sp. TaxID=472 RepID=UPI00388D0189